MENRYKYNGKELQHGEFSDGTGLEAYDYGARMMDPQIGRMWTQDRFAEKYHPVSPYQYAANNPIIHIDINGDSIPTIFYDKDGNKTNVIPQQLVDAFQESYGIKLGYNTETNMLYGNLMEQDADAEDKGQSAWMNELGSEQSKGSFTIGYNLDFQLKPVKYGATDLPGTLRSIIDLADFNADGSAIGVSYPNGFRKENFNLARVLEHEFLGHAVDGLSDYPNSDVDPGPNSRAMNKLLPDGLMPRQSYGTTISPTVGGLWFGSKTDPANPTKPDPASSIFLPVTLSNSIISAVDTHLKLNGRK